MVEELISPKMLLYVNAGLMTFISLLISLVIYFLKGSFDEAKKFKNNFEAWNKKAHELQQQIVDHQIHSYKLINEVRNEIHSVAKSTRENVESTQKELRNISSEVTKITVGHQSHAGLLNMAQKIFEDHKEKLEKTHSHIIKITKELYLIKNKKAGGASE